MGLLFTSKDTRRIIDTLNTAFDGPNGGLAAIRGMADPNSSEPVVQKRGQKIAEGKWKPGRLARMLQLLPYDQNPNASTDPTSPNYKGLGHRATKRWHYFLHTVVGYTDTTNTVL